MKTLLLALAVGLPLMTMACSASSEDDAASGGAAQSAAAAKPGDAELAHAVALAKVNASECEAKNAWTGAIYGYLSYGKELAQGDSAGTWKALRARMVAEPSLKKVLGADVMFWELVDEFDDTRAGLDRLLHKGTALSFYADNEAFELTFDDSASGDPPNWATLRKADGRAFGGTYKLSDGEGNKIKIEFQPDQMSEEAGMTFELYRHTIEEGVFSYKLDVVKAETGAETRTFSNFATSCRPPAYASAE